MLTGFGRRARVRSIFVCLFTLVALTLASDGFALRIMTYNILNYSSGREADYRIILEESQPDVLVVQEILSQTGVNNYLNNVLNMVNPGEWSAGPFVNGYDTDNGIFYRTDKIDSVSHHIIGTELRDIDEWTIQPAGYTSEEAAIRLYVVHLKASQGSTEEAKRLAEVTEMRDWMETYSPGQNYIVTGDFNIYDSYEPAYQYMLSTTHGLAGVVQDPLGMPGNWHNSSSFASIHSQSPRTTQFGGGANGGLDDRFDILLVGPSVQDGEGFDIIEETYTTLGQDGLHFNVAIIDSPPNAAVSMEVAQAIHDASDHLPVFADFQLPPQLVADATLSFPTVIVGGTSNRIFSVSNGATAPADELDYSMSAPTGFSAPAGDFEVAAGSPANQHTIELSTGNAGFFSGNMGVDTDDPDNLTFLVWLDGLVLNHAQPSVNDNLIALDATLDFGTNPPGSFSDLAAETHNFDYAALQALLEVYDASIVGDPRFSIVGGFSPVLVDDTAATWTIHFDDTSAIDGIYTATLTFLTRDQQDLDGATDLSDLTFDLVATVDATASDIAIIEPNSGPTRIGFNGIQPNPFSPSTTIRFGLGRSGPARIAIFDVGGRMVRDLFFGDLPVGDHQVVWDGRDSQGRQSSAGIYFVRLRTVEIEETRTVIRAR